MDFRVNHPTPIEFIMNFLYLSDSTFDFNDLIENDILNFVYVSLLGKS